MNSQCHVPKPPMTASLSRGATAPWQNNPKINKEINVLAKQQVLTPYRAGAGFTTAGSREVYEQWRQCGLQAEGECHRGANHAGRSVHLRRRTCVTLQRGRTRHVSDTALRPPHANYSCCGGRRFTAGVSTTYRVLFILIFIRSDNANPGQI